MAKPYIVQLDFETQVINLDGEEVEIERNWVRLSFSTLEEAEQVFSDRKLEKGETLSLLQLLKQKKP